MSIDLSTGTNSYVSLGTGTDIVSTRPYTMAICFNSGGIGTTLLGLFSQGQYNQGSGWGGFVYDTGSKKGGSYWPSDAFNSTFELDGTISFVVPDNGWYLAVFNYFTSGGVNRGGFLLYSFTDDTWSTYEFGNSAAIVNIPPNAGEEAAIGAVNISGSVQGFIKTKVSWVAMWADDFGGLAISPASARLTDLIANGPWGTENDDYIFFMPFSGVANDLGAGNHDGTVIGGATYAEAGPGELPGGVDLTVDDATIALTSDAIVLTQGHNLVVADAAIALSSDNITLSVNATNLVVADATMVLSSDSIALTQVHYLVVSDALILMTSDSITFDVPSDMVDFSVAITTSKAFAVQLVEARHFTVEF